MSLKEKTKVIQKAVGVSADGIYGDKTATAIIRKLGLSESQAKLTQSEVRSDQSVMGKRGENLIMIDLPYPMRLSWDLATTTQRLSVNKACADSLARIFKRTLDHYGLAKIKELGLDILGGCFNNRKMSGSSSWSIHSWGCAVDMDPDNNQLKWNKGKAKLAKAEYVAFWEIVESEGWHSLGREKDYDWMHFQYPAF